MCENSSAVDRLVSGDILVISGSVPGTLPQDVYERIMERLQGRNIRVIVDAEKGLLTRDQPSENSLMRTARSRTQAGVRASSSPSLACVVLESQPESLWAPAFPQSGGWRL